MNETPEPAPEAPAYAYRPSLLGAAMEFRLSGDGIGWAHGGRSGHIPFRDVRALRMSFKPKTMQPYRFVTEIWADRAPKLDIVSCSWKSLTEQERLDPQYRAFVTELNRRLAQERRAVRFERGTHPFFYWPGVILFSGLALTLAVMTARAFTAYSVGGGVVIGGMLAIFLWHGAMFFRRNWPGRYEPAALPPELLPKG